MVNFKNNYTPCEINCLKNVKNYYNSNFRCFQDLWSIAVGQSALQSSELIEKELLDSVDSLKLGLDYFKEYKLVCYRNVTVS